MECDNDYTTKTCPRCSPTELVPRKGAQWLQHIGSHILFDTISRSDEPCGFCLRPYPACVIYLRRASATSDQINLPKTICPGKLAFNYKPASLSSDSTPCTNVPILCPLCPKSHDTPAVWKYNFQAHLKRAHPTAIPSHYHHLSDISRSEKALMLVAWNKRHKQRRETKKQGKLVIAEGFSTRLALR